MKPETSATAAPSLYLVGPIQKYRNIAIALALLVSLHAPCPAATPAPAVTGVTDSAGYGPRVAPGSLASIFGTNLAADTASASAFPLPTSLGGASVTIGTTSVPLLYASPTQINFQVPSLSAGTSTLIVHGPGGNSTAFSFTVTSAAPAIFQYGANHAVAQNGGALNSPTNPAPAGSVITLYLTGIGAVDHAVAPGSQTPDSPLSNATATKSATIGPQDASIQFLGLTPGFAGLAQANIQVPTLPTGDYPIVLTIGGYLSASAILSVSGSGTAYTSPLVLSGSTAFSNTTGSSIALYNNVAYVCGSKRIVMVDVTDATQPFVIGDFGSATFNGNGVRCAINLAASVPYLVEIFAASSGNDSFAIYSLSNPRSPGLLVVASTSYPNMTNLSFAGNYAFVSTNYITYYLSNHAVVAQNGDFLVFDFSNPAHPLYSGMLQPSSQAGFGNQNLKPYSKAISPYYAYIASSTATGTSTAGTGVLNVIDIATPSTPVAVNQVSIAQAAILLRFDISGSTLLIAGNTAGQRNPGNPDFDFMGNLTLTTMDVSSPATPSLIATTTYTTTQVNGTLQVAVFGNGIFAIVNGAPNTDNDGPTALAIVDARQPDSLLLYPFQSQFGFSGLLTTNNGFLLAPTSLGLNIYQLQL